MAALPAIASTVEQLDDAIDVHRARGASIAVVMTMGALHSGHAELIKVARGAADVVVVTIFVNPLQFGPDEDLDRYPRQLARDVDVCAREGASIVFAPAPEVVYPATPLVTVTAGRLGDRLCGRSRPGHFDGVLTVVAKLLHLVGPDVAVFGEKDAQQLVLIRRMVADLDFRVEVVGVPTIREPDGLAMSSRNALLTPDDRVHALALHRALQAGEAAADAGPDAVRRAVRSVFDEVGANVRLDYAELVDPRTLGRLDQAGEGLLAVAAWVGSTRLIDNVVLNVGESAGKARTHKEP
ncbi:MAG TPA: pantoate--beta-alanine ligase [Mycobacteriales bacterium]|nr:pantoate--beta-alanine ligase [Mycobacteriales bacterium]